MRVPDRSQMFALQLTELRIVPLFDVYLSRYMTETDTRARSRLPFLFVRDEIATYARAVTHARFLADRADAAKLLSRAQTISRYADRQIFRVETI